MNFWLAPWHWHPIFVHFSVALLFTASALYIVAGPANQKSWAATCRNAACWNFWLGIVMAAITAAAGILAYFTVPNIDEDTRMAINRHVGAAVITVALYLVLAFFLWRRQRKNLLPGGGWTITLVLAMALLSYTGYLGGGLVYQRGVGVGPTTATPASTQPAAQGTP